MKKRTRKRGPWRIIKSRTVYKNPWISVREDGVIRPDGKHGIYGVVTILSGVGVVPVDDKKNIYLTKEFHYAVGRVTIEAVSGGMEGGESKLKTAQRELEEELGFQAKKWTYLGKLYPLTSVISMENHLYLAQGLVKSSARPEGTEKIELVKIPFRRALQWVKSGKISDATTIVAILKSAEYLGFE